MDGVLLRCVFRFFLVRFLSLGFLIADLPSVRFTECSDGLSDFLLGVSGVGGLGSSGSVVNGGTCERTDGSTNCCCWSLTAAGLG